ncbi:MAG TPA: sensor histidine kinase [Thermoleophilaceae bacterium]|nr:sensor histidine kinase [Thermoleophilaceae bacterium]
MLSPPHKTPGDSLIGQVVAANVVLVTLTVLAASLAAGLDLSISEQRWQFIVLALVIALTFCVNLWMLQRRFGPLEHLIERIERIDPAEPASFEIARDPVAEIDRLAESFRRLLRRVDDERRRSGKLVLRAQEEERRRVARDLHDEVNQALTAILLRLEALAQDTPSERSADVAELKRLTSQAMDELLTLARQLRPAALDDHGLVPAIESQLRVFSERTGIATRLSTAGRLGDLDEEQQTALYRVTQEALVNAGRHGAATLVQVELAAVGERTELHVRDDGKGFDPAVVRGEGLGLEGMAERARLVGGELDVRSSPGAGTEISMRVP